jgi:sialate O-acetylesterase
MKNSAAILFVFAFVLHSFAQVRVPRLVSDGMVIQRETPVRIWGWAGPGEKVTVRFDGKATSTITGENQRWEVMLDPHAPGGPYNLDIDGINHIGLRNVLVGDVWVCSGQSNMELTMERVKEKYPEVVARSENSLIRQYRLPLAYDFNRPHDDLSSGRWEAVSPASVLSFSAVAYFFARELYGRNKVPVGLITNAVGGAPAEAWLSASALKAFPEADAEAAKVAHPSFIDSVTASERAADIAWYHRIWELDKGMHDQRSWYDTSYDASGWSSMSIPGYWADQGMPPVNGVVWFRREIEAPAAMAGVPAKLLLGRIIDRDSVYVNGIFSGTIGYQYPPRRYELPAGRLRAGKNIIVVRVINSEGRGGFAPDKPYRLIAGGDTIDLKGSWQYRLGAVAGALAPTTFFQYKPLGLYNGMIAPLLPYVIKGVIWYQGEANTGHAETYRRIFSSMITDWRRHWGQADFPFLYVQLPNFMEAKDSPTESKWAELREAQRETLSVPNTAMAVTIDVGEWNDLHPLNKADVGKRLALAAEALAYGRKNFVWCGPLYQSMKVAGNRVRLRFTEVSGGLVARGGGELHGFALAGADNKFVWARARIDGKDVIVWSDQIAHPVAVRYAWADNPAGANLYNRFFYESDGLPASPFEGRVR